MNLRAFSSSDLAMVRRLCLPRRSRIFRVAMLSLLPLLPTLAADESQSPRGKQPANAASQDKGQGIEVRGALSDSTVLENHKLWFVLTISNRTTAPIASVRLERLFAEGLRVTSMSNCNSAQGQAGGALTPTLPCETLADNLDAGKSLTISGEIVAGDDPAKKRVLALIQWKQGGATCEDFVSLGEVTIQSGWEEWRASAIYDLLKDLTLPVVLIFLATALGFYDKSREENRKKDAELRAQTAQTWTSMLPESHKLATKYYMPVDAAASATLDELIERDDAINGKDALRQAAAEDRAFYYLLLMSRRFRALADDRGGWYFKNRIGEQLVARSLENFRVLFLCQPPAAQTQWSTAIGAIAVNEKLGAFQTRLAGTDAQALLLQTARANFQTWLASPEFAPAVAYLRCMRILLSFEMNRPYQYWYGSIEILPLEGALKVEVESTIKKVAEEWGSFPAIPAKDVEEYLREATTVKNRD